MKQIKLFDEEYHFLLDLIQYHRLTINLHPIYYDMSDVEKRARKSLISQIDYLYKCIEDSVTDVKE